MGSLASAVTANRHSGSIRSDSRADRPQPGLRKELGSWPRAAADFVVFPVVVAVHREMLADDRISRSGLRNPTS